MEILEKIRESLAIIENNNLDHCNQEELIKKLYDNWIESKKAFTDLYDHTDSLYKQVQELAVTRNFLRNLMGDINRGAEEMQYQYVSNKIWDALREYEEWGATGIETGDILRIYCPDCSEALVIKPKSDLIKPYCKSCKENKEKGWFPGVLPSKKTVVNF